MTQYIFYNNIHWFTPFNPINIYSVTAMYMTCVRDCEHMQRRKTQKWSLPSWSKFSGEGNCKRKTIQSTENIHTSPVKCYRWLDRNKQRVWAENEGLSTSDNLVSHGFFEEVICRPISQEWELMCESRRTSTLGHMNSRHWEHGGVNSPIFI